MTADARELGATAHFGPFALTPTQRLLSREGRPVAIGSRGLDILIALVLDHGQVLTQRQLFERAWPGLTVEESNLRVTISGLRKVLGEGADGARYIENAVGRGYCFVAPVTWRSPETEDAPPDVRPAEPPPPAPPPSRDRVRRLPLPSARVVGREAVVDELVDQVIAHRFVSVVAAGGMGKTTVAALAAARLQARLDLEVVFVDLSQASGADRLAPAVAAALGLNVQSRDIEAAIIADLAARPTLLVLDCCEHLVDPVARLCERLAAETPDLLLLTTSREALRVAGEHVHILGPLAFPAEDAVRTAEEALAYPAVQLFAERAGVSGHRGALTDDDARIAADICRRLDGLALAIELVASRVGVFGFAGVAAMLDESPGLAWPGRRDAAPRHRTLQALLDWSHALLDERDQQVLRRLSRFVGPFSVKDAQAIAAAPTDDGLDVADALTSLVDKSLVWTSAGAGPIQFRLLDTTRAYAAAKLEQSGEADATAARHARRVLDRLAGDGRDRTLPDGAAAVPTTQIGDIGAALEWAGARGSDEILVELATAAVPVFLALSQLSECETWCSRALAALAKAQLGKAKLDKANRGKADRGAPAELLLVEGLAIARMFGRGNHDAVRAAIRQGLDLAAASGARAAQMRLLAGEHIFLTRIGDFPGSLACARQSLELCDPAGDPGAAAIANWMVGTSQHLCGNQAVAEEFVDRGFLLWSSAGAAAVDLFGFDHMVRTLIVQSRVLWLRGATRRAAEVAAAAIAEAERRGQPVNLCIALIYTATVALWDRALDDAEARIGRLIAHASKHGVAPYVAVGAALAGELAIARGRPVEGIARLTEALGRLQQEAHRLLSPAFMGSLAEGLRLTGDLPRARATAAGAIQDAAAVGDHYDLPRLLLIAAGIERDDGAPGAAASLATRALAVARSQAALQLELQAATALLDMAVGAEAEAAARTQLADLCARFPGDRATRHFAAAEALLAPTA